MHIVGHEVEEVHVTETTGAITSVWAYTSIRSLFASALDDLYTDIRAQLLPSTKTWGPNCYERVRESPKQSNKNRRPN